MLGGNISPSSAFIQCVGIYSGITLIGSKVAHNGFVHVDQAAAQNAVIVSDLRILVFKINRPRQTWQSNKEIRS